MNSLFKASFFLFNWLFVPLTVSIAFFIKSPHFFPENIIKAKILAISILTIFLPVVFYFLMRSLKFVKSTHLTTPQDLKIPLTFYGICLLLATNFILNTVDYFELRLFFWGFLISDLVTVVLCFTRVKVNMQVLGISSFIGFCLGFSYFYHLDFNYWLAAAAAVSGLIFSAEVHFQKDTKSLLAGSLIGFLPQILFFGYFSFV